jgi:hypothetical protein
LPLAPGTAIRGTQANVEQAVAFVRTLGLDTSTNRKLAGLSTTQADSQVSQLTNQLSYEIDGRLVG